MRVLILLLLTQICFAQQNQKTIVVQGKANTWVHPDIVLITLRLEKSDTSQSKVMAKINQQVNRISDLLLKQGIEQKQIKIAEYELDNNYNIQLKRKEYRVTNTLTARLKLNEKHVNTILKAIESNPLNEVGVSFDYTLSDSLEKVTKARLMRDAIANAKANADLISETLKIQLKGIVQISKTGYDSMPVPQLETAKFTPPVSKYDREVMLDSSFEKFEVEEKEFGEDITIVFEIGT